MGLRVSTSARIHKRIAAETFLETTTNKVTDVKPWPQPQRQASGLRPFHALSKDLHVSISVRNPKAIAAETSQRMTMSKVMDGRLWQQLQQLWQHPPFPSLRGMPPVSLLVWDPLALEVLLSTSRPLGICSLVALM